MVLNGTAHIRLLAQTDGYVDQVDQDGFGVIGACSRQQLLKTFLGVLF